MPSLEAAIHDAPGSTEILGGEPILGAVCTVPPPHNPNDPAHAIGGLAGGLLAYTGSLRSREPVSFKLPGSLAIAVTSSRFLFWAHEGFWRPRPTRFVGELPVSNVEKVELSRRRGKLAFWLRSGTTVELDIKDKDIEMARAFTDAACERIAVAARPG